MKTRIPMARTSPDASTRRGPLGLVGRFRRDARPLPPAPTVPGMSVVDEESGLGNERELYELLRREIARSRRYGDRSTLVVFDVSVAGYTPTPEHPLPPSPVRFVAESLLSTIRDADVVTRLSMTHFAVLLTECDEDGARRFAERARTKIASSPYARDASETGVYVRAWAGYAAWDHAISTPEAYVVAAMTELERTRPMYERQQLWFSGDLD